VARTALGTPDRGDSSNHHLASGRARFAERHAACATRHSTASIAARRGLTKRAEARQLPTHRPSLEVVTGRAAVTTPLASWPPGFPLCAHARKDMRPAPSTAWMCIIALRDPELRTVRPSLETSRINQGKRRDGTSAQPLLSSLLVERPSPPIMPIEFCRAPSHFSGRPFHSWRHRMPPVVFILVLCPYCQADQGPAHQEWRRV